MGTASSKAEKKEKKEIEKKEKKEKKEIEKRCSLVEYCMDCIENRKWRYLGQNDKSGVASKPPRQFILFEGILVDRLQRQRVYVYWTVEFGNEHHFKHLREFYNKYIEPNDELSKNNRLYTTFRKVEQFLTERATLDTAGEQLFEWVALGRPINNAIAERIKKERTNLTRGFEDVD